MCFSDDSSTFTVVAVADFLPLGGYPVNFALNDISRFLFCVVFCQLLVFMLVGLIKPHFGF